MNKEMRVNPNLPERWKAVSAHYEVSDLGRVRRLRHTVMRSNGRPFTKTDMLMKGSNDSDGYRQVRIDGRLIGVHVLVARAFIGPKPVGCEVCHDDGKRDNNRLSNLRYDTHKANIDDASKHGSLVGKNSRLTKTQAMDVKARIAAGESNASIARLYGVDPSMISNIKRGFTWRGL